MQAFHLQRRLMRFVLPVLIAAALVLALFTLTSWAASTIVWQSASSGLPTTGYAEDVAIGDANNDGKPDLIVAYYSGSGGVQVFQGDGTGGWITGTLSTGLPTGGLFSRVAVGDVNNDGKLDIVASPNAGGLIAYLGNGLGSWTPVTTGLPSTGSYAGLALGDVNWDGRLDVIAAGSGGIAPGINVYLSAGSSFSQTVSPTTVGNFNEIAAGYVDKNGYLDIAAADTTGSLDFWQGGPNNTWTLNNTGLTTPGGFRGVAIGDIDHDGKPDLIASRNLPVGSGGGGVFTYLWNQAANSWSLAPNQIPIGGTYDQLALADLNNDGWLDLIAGGMYTMGTNGFSIWLGGPTGFVASTSPAPTTGSLNSVAAGDFDRNGLPDIAVGDSNGADVQAWRDTGSRQILGAWRAIASPNPSGSLRAFGIGDFNRDGNLDVVMERSFGGGLAMWVGDGGNTWTSCPITESVAAQSGQYDSLVVGQFNHDYQEPDVIAARDDGQGIYHFSQYGTDCGYWYPSYAITTTYSWRALAAGDINNDSYEDFVAAPASVVNGGLRLWLNGPNGFTLSSSPAITGNFYATALGDFNNDGKLDIAAADGAGGGVVVLQRGLRPPWSTIVVTQTGTYYAIAAGDFNNDGRLDIVAGHNTPDQGLDVFINQGGGGWSLWPSPDPTGQYYDLSVGDFNHDGFLDILGGRNNGGMVVWAGDGAGGWSAANTDLPTTGTYWTARFGHIDHDGNLDILGTEAGSGFHMWTAAEATPPTISNIQPGGWISTTKSPTINADIIDTGSGLNVSSGQYRYSTNGGTTWSALAAASIGGVNGTTTTQNLGTVSIPFGQDSATLNKIELRGTDMVSNVAIAQAIIKIDTVPPTAPTAIASSDHVTGTWSNNHIVNVNWSGATDLTSGVYGYAVLFDQITGTVPPPTTTLYSITSAPSPVLGDGNHWYAHVRTRDAAGNFSVGAIHLGPFFIDTTPPNNPTDVHSTSHTPSVWSSNSHIVLTWSGAADPGGSGVSGYAYVFDTNPSTLPSPVLNTSSTTATSGALSSSNSWYFHIRTQDAAGNWSATAINVGPFYVDVTAPSASATSPASVGSTAIPVSWSGNDFGQSGIASYDVQSKDVTTSGAWTTWRSATTTTSGTFYGTNGHIYQFRARARDNVGNLGTYTGSYDSQTGIATIDLAVKNPGIEVNQAVQDLSNSVYLIANKRTFVRCYVDSSGGGTIGAVPARLYVYRGATYMGTLVPANSGGLISVKSSPDRSQLNDAFYFDVPTGWLNVGSVTFQCQVNTPAKYADSNTSNNLRSTSVTFIKSPTMNVLMVDANYWYGGVVRHVRSVDRTRLAAWLRAAYPINSLNVYYGYMDPPYSGLPNVDTLNNDLAWNQSKKVLGAGEDPWTRYYGQVIQVDNNTFMRGKARGIPDTVASGPTGPAGGWDPDTSFGDWYGGHEIGHTFGRYHAEFCGAADGASYPYPGGRISPTTGQWTNTTLYGIDWSLPSPLVITPDWTDVMTYCSYEWMSDFTYKGIWSRMFLEKPVTKAQIQSYKAQGVEYLALFGQIVTSTNTVTLSTFYRVPNAFDVFGRDISGTYHIKLLGAGNAVLADYNFSPRGSPETNDPVTALSEYVPWITGTQKIVIASSTQALVTRTVSTHAPTIALTAPTGGITLTGSTVNASWTASDADNDPLTFSIDYSRDGGVTWTPLSAQITATAATLNLDLLPGSTQGKFRVWVSDGVNTAFAETTGVFGVGNKAPQITSVSPISGSTYVVSQTISFEAATFDPEDGPLPDDHLQWSSNIDGVLGTGSSLQLDTLSIGTHIITVTATDSQNVQTTQTFTVIVGPEVTGEYEVFLPLILR